MEYDWKDTFHYTQRERRGIFILATILVFLLFVRSYIRIEQPSPTDFSSFKKEIIEFEKGRTATTTLEDTISGNQIFNFNPNIATKEAFLQLGIKTTVADRIIKYRSKGGRFRKKEDLKKIYGLSEVLFEELSPYIKIPPSNSPKPKKATFKKPKKTLRPFRFDPNLVSLQELVAMGLSSKTAQQIINYRNKGGKFYKKEDFKKIYALNNSQYQQLAPFILIKETAKRQAHNKQTFKPKSYTSSPPIKVDVNKARLEDWQKLKGIGPYYAKKIVVFREKLGGFSSIEQVGTTYNLPDSVFQKIHPHLHYSPIFRPVAINTIPLDSLSQHPFINNRQAKAIINYRANHGVFKNEEDIRKVKVLSKEQLALLKPYLRY